MVLVNPIAEFLIIGSGTINYGYIPGGQRRRGGGSVRDAYPPHSNRLIARMRHAARAKHPIAPLDHAVGRANAVREVADLIFGHDGQKAGAFARVTEDGEGMFADPAGRIRAGASRRAREGLRHVAEKILPVVMHRGSLAMHQAVRTDDLSTEILADALMAQTDAEKGNARLGGGAGFRGQGFTGQHPRDFIDTTGIRYRGVPLTLSGDADRPDLFLPRLLPRLPGPQWRRSRIE